MSGRPHKKRTFRQRTCFVPTSETSGMPTIRPLRLVGWVQASEEAYRKIGVDLGDCLGLARLPMLRLPVIPNVRLAIEAEAVGDDGSPCTLNPSRSDLRVTIESFRRDFDPV